LTDGCKSTIILENLFALHRLQYKLSRRWT